MEAAAEPAGPDARRVRLRCFGACYRKGNCPLNFFFLPVLVVANFLAIAAEIAYGIAYQQPLPHLHSIQAFLNVFFLISLTISTFTNWKNDREHRLIPTLFISRVTLGVSLVTLLVFAPTLIWTVYKVSLTTSEGVPIPKQPMFLKEPFFYLAPLPVLVVSLLTICYVNWCSHLALAVGRRDLPWIFRQDLTVKDLDFLWVMGIQFGFSSFQGILLITSSFYKHHDSANRMVFADSVCIGIMSLSMFATMFLFLKSRMGLSEQLNVNRIQAIPMREIREM